MIERNCEIEKDSTYEQIIQFMLNASSAYDRKTLEDWIISRGSILDVFIEFLEANNKVDYASPQEKNFMESYSCLTPFGKKSAESFVCFLHYVETDERRILKKWE